MTDELKIPISAPGADDAQRKLHAVAKAEAAVGAAAVTASKRSSGAYEQAAKRMRALEAGVRDLRYAMDRSGGGTEQQAAKLARLTGRVNTLRDRLKGAGRDLQTMATDTRAMGSEVDRAGRRLKRLDERIRSLRYSMRRGGRATSEQRRQLSRMTATADRLRGRLKGLVSGTDKVGGAFGSLGRMVLGGGILEGIRRGVMGIVDALAAGVAKAAELGEQTANLNRSIAGTAAQFGTGETPMRKLITSIGHDAGAGSGDIGSIGSLLTAAQSAGLIGEIADGVDGGPARMADADFATVSDIATFQQRTGTQGSGSHIAKLVAAAREADPQMDTQGALGLLETTFKSSQLSDWNDYLSGATGGTLGSMAMGIDPTVALSEYSAQAKFAKSGAAAGETYRTVQERFVLADDKKIVAKIDALYGEGTYWRLKESDPTRLDQMIKHMLTAPQGAERAELYGELGIQPEMSGRLGKVAAGRPLAGRIYGEAAAAGGSGAADEAWRKSSRATLQRMQLADVEDAANLGDQYPAAAGMVGMAKTGRDAMAIESPGSLSVLERLNFGSDKQSATMKQFMYREMKDRGYDDPFATKAMALNYDMKTGAVTDPTGRFDKTAAVAREIIQERAAGPTFNGGTHYHLDGKRDPAGVQQPPRGQ